MTQIVRVEKTMPTVGEFIGTDEVKAKQKEVKAQLENVRSALQRCATAGAFTPDKTPGEWESWQSLKTRCENYVGETPSWFSQVSQYGRGEALQKEIIAWHPRAAALGCDPGPAPPMPPTPEVPVLSTAGLSQIALLVIVALFLLKQK